MVTGDEVTVFDLHQRRLFVAAALVGQIAAGVEMTAAGRVDGRRRLAFQRNIDAWETAVPYFEANNPGTHFLEGFFGALANDYSGVGFSDYQARLAVENIEATYRDLREIAIAYGASIPTL